MRATNRVELTFEVPFTHPSWVIEDDVTMPEPATQDECTRVLVSVLRCEAEREGHDWQVHRNRALRWDEKNPRVGVDPDVCLLEPAPKVSEKELRSIRLWQPGFTAPKLAIEVVSENTAAKDYQEGPTKYAASRTRELWIFDPHRYGPSEHGGPWVLQVWERGRNHQFRRVYAGDGPAWSEALQAWLVVTEAGQRLRISRDEAGTKLWPTEAEYAQKQRAGRKREKLRAEQEKQRADAEHAEKLAALARVAELEALLRKERP